MQECNDLLFRELDIVAPKGKRKRVRIYQPLCLKEYADNNLLKNLGLHNEGLSFYYNKQWHQAKIIFNQLATQNADDEYYTVMLEKINNGEEALYDTADVSRATEDSSIENTRESPHK